MESNKNISEKFDEISKKIMESLQDVQLEYYRQERYVPERFENLGLDNIVNNACFYDIGWFVDNKKYDDAKKYLKETSSYLHRCLRQAEVYKPGITTCDWHGFDADIYYPLRKALDIMEEEMFPLIESANKS